MTNQASELDELCKEVYERTGLADTIDYFYLKNNGDYSVQRANHIQVDHNWWKLDGEVPTKCFPLYTSDYLLGRLPSSIDSKEDKGKRAYLTTRKDEADPDDLSHGYTYFAWYVVVGDGLSDFGVYADTPLKALLKLTIALSEAGELK